MKVRDVMVGTPAYCGADTNLGSAIEILWNRNCGFLPVVDEQEKVIGVVTDRDLCIAMGTRNRLAGDLTVSEVVSPQLFYCKPEDDIHAALRIMGDKKVRRLPVVDNERKLRGILAMDDIVMHAQTSRAGKFPELTAEDILGTLKNLYWPALPQMTRQTQTVV
ncbi:MAG TPA: CBS domain-containing protein [Candidatus Acidoferrales bacterium]|nr:CBS domain-containing protein [Candidatus Acidoferrales bacterium]